MLVVWPGGVLVKTSDRQLYGRWFDCQISRFQEIILDELFTRMRLLRHQAEYFSTNHRAVILCGWEGNRRFAGALVMRQRLKRGLSTYGLKA